jgi:hypothetical protein
MYLISSALHLGDKYRFTISAHQAGFSRAGVQRRILHDELWNFPITARRLKSSKPFRNLGNGKFVELGGEAGPATTALHVSRGCAFGDFAASQWGSLEAASWFAMATSSNRSNCWANPVISPQNQGGDRNILASDQHETFKDLSADRLITIRQGTGIEKSRG